MEPRLALILWVVTIYGQHLPDDFISNSTLPSFDLSSISENISITEISENNNSTDVTSQDGGSINETSSSDNPQVTTEVKISTEPVLGINESETVAHFVINSEPTFNSQIENEEFAQFTNKFSTTSAMMNASEDDESSGDGSTNETLDIVASHLTDNYNLNGNSFTQSLGLNSSTTEDNAIPQTSEFEEESKTSTAASTSVSEEYEIITQHAKFLNKTSTKENESHETDLDVNRNATLMEESTEKQVENSSPMSIDFEETTLDKNTSTVVDLDVKSTKSTEVSVTEFAEVEGTNFSSSSEGEFTEKSTSINVSARENRTGKMIPFTEMKLSTILPTDEVSLPKEGETQVIFEPEDTTPFSADVSTETRKHHEDLSDEEFANAVTVIFTVSQPAQMDVYWYEERNRKFRDFVVNSINSQDAQGWPHLDHEGITTFEKFNIEWVRRRRSTPANLKPDDLVYIAPSPMAENRDIYVSFFVRNSSTSDPTDVVSSLRLFHAVNTSRAALEHQMELNISRVATGIVLVRYLESFFVRHAIIFTALLAVAVFCICFIIFGIIYIRCKSFRGKWDRNEFGEKNKLSTEMRQSRDVGEFNPEIQNDESQIEKNGRACVNGNSMHVIQLSEEDGWVKPFEDGATPKEPRKKTEDTKL